MDAQAPPAPGSGLLTLPCTPPPHSQGKSTNIHKNFLLLAYPHSKINEQTSHSISCIPLPRSLTPCDPAQNRPVVLSLWDCSCGSISMLSPLSFPSSPRFQNSPAGCECFTRALCPPVVMYSQLFPHNPRICPPPHPLSHLGVSKPPPLYFTHLEEFFLFILQLCPLTVTWSAGAVCPSIIYIAFERTHP